MKHMHFLVFTFAFGFLVLMAPQVYAQNIIATTIPVVTATSFTTTSVPMVNPITAVEPVVSATTAVPVTGVAVHGINSFPIASVDLGNSSLVPPADIPSSLVPIDSAPVPHVPVSGFTPHSGSFNGSMLTPVDLGDITPSHGTSVQEPITPPSMVPIPPITQQPATNSSGSGSHHSGGSHVVGSVGNSHASTPNTFSGDSYKVTTVVTPHTPEYDPNSTSNVRVAKLPLIAEEDMVDFDSISHTSTLGASVHNVPVQIPLAGVLAGIALILMIAIAIRRNATKKQQTQVVYA